MFNPSQGQQGQNIQQSQQMMFQGQGQGQGQGQQQNAPQQRRVMTEEDRQKYINSLKSHIERFGPESPQGKQAQRQLSVMMQYIQRAQQGQSSDAQAAAQGRPVIGHSVSNPAQFQPPPNADPQRVYNFRVNLTTKYTQAQQKMKQIRDQLQIQSQQMAQLTQSGQTQDSLQVSQLKATMNELAKQFKQIESWYTAAKNSGNVLPNPIQQNRLQAVASANTDGASGGPQPGGAGAVQMQQQSSSMGVEQQGQQQNAGSQQQAQPPQGQVICPLRIVSPSYIVCRLFPKCLLFALAVIYNPLYLSTLSIHH